MMLMLSVLMSYSWTDIYLRHPFEDDEICQSKGKEGKEAGQSVDKWYVRLY